MITSDVLDHPGIAHGFCTREGGVSTGVYQGLNCGWGSDDDRAAILENRRIVADRFGQTPDRLVTMFQIHSAKVATVTEPWAPDKAPEVDGIVTDRPGIILGALAADCAPILFADPEARIIGACHAGWKGALHGVAQATVEAMEQLGANRDDIHACIGPCIAATSYEVGPEFPAPFLAQSLDNDRFFQPGNGDRLYFDNPGYLRTRLTELGLARVTATRHDTLTDPDRFYSYRRSCHLNEPDYGRQISVIMLDAQG